MSKEPSKVMTVAEMITALSQLPPNAVIRFALQTYTRAYPSRYIMAPQSKFVKQGHEDWWSVNNDCVTMILNLGEGYTIHEKKNKQS